MVRISTRRPRSIVGVAAGGSIGFERHRAAVDLVQALFHRTGELRDDVRAAAFAQGASVDPTAPWQPATTTADGVTVDIRVLVGASSWVALASPEAEVVAIEAADWPLDATGLVSMTDLAPYRAGTDGLGGRFR